jgi:ADP-heptose:LPS heptosyltransferase
VQVCQIIPRGFKAGCLEYFHTTSWRWKLGFLFGSQRYEIAIYPAISAEPLGNWIFRSVRAQKRWAVEGDLFHQFPRQRYAALKRATRILARPKEIHELERNADLARQCGASDVNTLPQISLDAAANENSARLLSSWRELAESRGASGLLGVVSSASMAKFSWPAENWRTALQQIWREHRLMPVLLSQNAICDPAIPHAVLNESIDVRTLSAILGQIDMVLSLDTGPAHISAAMRTPTVVLSNDGHPGRFFPWPDALWVKSLVHSMPCAGCVCKCPLAEAECLTRIKVADVLIAVGELRKSSFAEAA